VARKVLIESVVEGKAAESNLEEEKWRDTLYSILKWRKRK
jgi:hypothetical protein